MTRLTIRFAVLSLALAIAGVFIASRLKAQQVTTPAITALACAYNTSPPTVSSGNYVLVQCSNDGTLLGGGGGGGGGTSSNFGAAFPSAGTAAGFEYLSSPPTLSTGQMVAGQTDVNGNIKVNVVAGGAGGGAVTGAVGAFVDGWDVTEGTKADTAWTTGSGSVVSILKTISGNTGGATPAGTNAIGTVNPTTAANWGVGATGSAVPANGSYGTGDAQSAEPTKATTGNLTGTFLDLTGKVVTSPYANRENMVRGSASATGTGATTLIAAGGASVKTYVTDVECGRSDSGTAAIIVTLSDSASTILVLPNSGGGGGNNKTFNVPLVTAANAAFTFTAGTGTTTVYCSAQGFSGY